MMIFTKYTQLRVDNRYLTLAERRGFAYEKILCFYSNADFVGVPIF